MTVYVNASFKIMNHFRDHSPELVPPRTRGYGGSGGGVLDLDLPVDVERKPVYVVGMPKTTTAATAANRRKYERKLASILRERGWVCVEPETVSALVVSK